MTLSKTSQPNGGPIRIAASLAGLLCGVLFVHLASAQTVLYSFTDGADGAEPIGGVVQDAFGTLYGETYIGGTTNCTSKYLPHSYGCGTLYSFNTTTGFKVLATFNGPNGAYGLNTPALIGSTLYGVTNNGGSADDGVVFSVHTDGTAFTLLHQFSAAPTSNIIL